MKRLSCVIGLVAAFSSAFASAQPVAKEEKKAAPLNEIERGFFFEGRGGAFSIINPPAAAGSPSYFSFGQALGVDIGVDIGERLAISLFFMGSANRMGSDYTGKSTTGLVSGDFGALTPGAAVKVRVVGFDDSQDVKRTWIYVRAAGGVSFYTPPDLIQMFDVFVSAGPGVEYYTHLRHLVIGLEANFNFFALTQSFGFSILPTVKYAF